MGRKSASRFMVKFFCIFLPVTNSKLVHDLLIGGRFRVLCKRIVCGAEVRNS